MNTAGVPRVSVVIPSWNGREQLEGVLESLEAQKFRDFETIVVDNGSTDGSIAYLAERWPQVRVLALDQNRGFAGAVNEGIKAGDSEYVALLNNDVELEPGWLAATTVVLDREASAASVASKLLEWSRRNVLDGAGDLVGWDGYCVRRGKGQRDRGQYDGSPWVLSACAAAALYRRRALDEVGPFDERFFAYIEDVDWGLRAQLAGWNCFYEHNAVAYHVGGESSSRIAGFEIFQCHRNILLMMVKDFPAPTLFAFVPWALARRFGSLLRAYFRGEGALLLRAWGAAARELPAALEARREIQAGRKRDGAEMLRLMRPAYLGAGWRPRSSSGQTTGSRSARRTSRAPIRTGGAPGAGVSASQ
jgi:GT2 family glycosyltransferase